RSTPPSSTRPTTSGSSGSAGGTSSSRASPTSGRIRRRRYGSSHRATSRCTACSCGASSTASSPATRSSTPRPDAAPGSKPSAAAAGAAPRPANVVVTPPGGQVHGGLVARDPSHPARLVAVYWDELRERRETCTVARSFDGGATWTSEAFAGAGSGNPLPSGMTLCRNPVAAFGPDGALYVAYEAAQLSGFAQVELVRSTDDGASFGPARLLDPDATGGGDRDPSIAAGTRTGRVYVAFERYTADEEQAEVDVVTSDGGAPVPVSP